MDTTPIHPRAHELQDLGRQRARSQAAYEEDDQRTRELVVELLRDDSDLRREDLAKLSGLGVDVVKRLATENDIPAPRIKAKTKARTDARIAQLIEQRPRATTAELAAAAGVSPQRITAYLREHNLPSRPRQSKG